VKLSLVHGGGRILLVLIVLLALLCAGCGWNDTSCQVTGQYVDDHGVARVVCIDQADGALLTIPKVQVPGPVKAGDTITGSVIYSK
jgi:acyl dehydratase